MKLLESKFYDHVLYLDAKDLEKSIREVANDIFGIIIKPDEKLDDEFYTTWRNKIAKSGNILIYIANLDREQDINYIEKIAYGIKKGGDGYIHVLLTSNQSNWSSSSGSPEWYTLCTAKQVQFFSQDEAIRNIKALYRKERNFCHDDKARRLANNFFCHPGFLSVTIPEMARGSSMDNLQDEDQANRQNPGEGIQKAISTVLKYIDDSDDLSALDLLGKIVFFGISNLSYKFTSALYDDNFPKFKQIVKRKCLIKYYDNSYVVQNSLAELIQTQLSSEKIVNVLDQLLNKWPSIEEQGKKKEKHDLAKEFASHALIFLSNERIKNEFKKYETNTVLKFIELIYSISQVYGLACSGKELSDIRFYLEEIKSKINLELLSNNYQKMILKTLFDIEIHSGNYSRASKYANDRMIYCEDKYGKDAIETAEAYCDYSYALFLLEGQENTERALQKLKDAINIFSSHKESPSCVSSLVLARSYNSFAMIQAKKGIEAGLKEAREYSKLVLEIREKNLYDGHPERADAHHDLAFTFTKFGGRENFKNALIEYREALTEFNKKFPHGHPLLASTIHEIGNVYFEMGDYEGAFKQYEKAYEMRRECLTENHPLLSYSLYGLGKVYLKRGGDDNLKVAIDKFKESINNWLKKYPEDEQSLGYEYAGLGLAYMQLGDKENALNNIALALKVRRNGLGEIHKDTFTSYFLLGEYYFNQNNLLLAEFYHSRALNLRCKNLTNYHPDLGRSYFAMAKIFLVSAPTVSNTVEKRRIQDKAKKYLEEAYNIFISNFDENNEEVRAIRDALKAIGNQPQLLTPHMSPAGPQGKESKNQIMQDSLMLSPDGLAGHSFIQKKELSLTKKLIEKSQILENIFEEILELLKEHNLKANSPSGFLIYAHDSKNSMVLQGNHSADAEEARKIIDWTHRIGINIYSDKHPYGNKDTAETEFDRERADNILSNQLCILPDHEHSVDFVIVCGSTLLKSYTVSEHYTKYRKALGAAYENATITEFESLKDQLTIATKRHRDHSDFHHLSTELILLEMRAIAPDKKTIALLLNGEKKDALPDFVRAIDVWIESTKWRKAGFFKGQEVYANQGLHEGFFELLIKIFRGKVKQETCIRAYLKLYQECIELLRDNYPEAEIMQTLTLSSRRIGNKLEKTHMSSSSSFFSSLPASSHSNARKRPASPFHETSSGPEEEDPAFSPKRMRKY